MRDCVLDFLYSSVFSFSRFFVDVMFEPAGQLIHAYAMHSGTYAFIGRFIWAYTLFAAFLIQPSYHRRMYLRAQVLHRRTASR